MTPPPTDSRLTVAVFGTYDVRQHPRVGVMIEAIEGLGHHVIRCNEPLDVSTEERIRVARQPLRAGPLILRLVSCWWRLIGSARRLGRHTPDVVVVGYLGVLDVHLARLCFAAPVILDHMAPVGGIARDRSLPFPRAFGLVDRLAATAASVVIWDTDRHAASAPPSEHGVAIPVGAQATWFDHSVESRDPSRPVSLCFYGLYTPLQGTKVIAEAIRLLADRSDITWTMIGVGQERPEVQDSIADVATVTWIDWVPAEQLPGVVAEHDICLGVFGATPKTSRVVPNKVYQGAAAGCAIITGDTAPQRDVLGDAGRYVPLADARALAEAVADMVDDRDRLLRMRHAARERAVQRFSPTALGPAVQALLDLAVPHQPAVEARRVQSAER